MIMVEIVDMLGCKKGSRKRRSLDAAFGPAQLFQKNESLTVATDGISKNETVLFLTKRDRLTKACVVCTTRGASSKWQSSKIILVAVTFQELRTIEFRTFMDAACVVTTKRRSPQL
mmetsp:Transcript_5059/g.12234  ORF Transcript_5059/g.12234 Transcript_5059/m.12234 type:complete len:116 (-) Transcript_5059:831-1178(-)